MTHLPRNAQILHMDFAATPAKKSQAVLVPLEQRMENTAVNLEAVLTNRIRLQEYVRIQESKP